MSVSVSDPTRGDSRVEVRYYVRRSENALGKEEFVPQQTEAINIGGDGSGGGGATNFEKVRKGKAEERLLNRNERHHQVCKTKGCIG